MATFTPAATPFYVQVTGGAAFLQSRGNGSAAWANITPPLSNPAPQAGIIQNPVAAVEYQFVATGQGTPVVLATQ
jgi:hypothetical protein